MITLTGTANQIEWAERIRVQVDTEFDRVARVLLEAAGKQSGEDQANTHLIIAILEEKRLEVMANPKAGYFIHDWQEQGDQVRQMIMKDGRYRAIKSRRQ
jgi:inactivated superfamily I helicase